MFYRIVSAGFACAWGALVVVWIVGMFFSKPTARHSSYASRLVLFGPALVVYLLAVSHAIPISWLELRVWPQTHATAGAGLALTMLGCCFAIWARVTLGSNWSSMPNVKREHELIVRGPYRLVRHPIYSGLLLGVAGAAVATGRLVLILAFFLAFVTYFVKMRQEEGLMLETFPEDYPAYRRRVKALIPGVL